MFGHDDKLHLTVNEITRIPSGTVVRMSSLISENDIRIDGSVSGDILCEGKLVLGPKGAIIGDVVCRNADVSGSITGNVTAGDIFTLTDSGVLRGNMRSAKLCVEKGATFEGECGIISADDFTEACRKFREDHE